MGSPTKSVGGGIVFSYHQVTFGPLSDVGEFTGLITATPMDRSVILPNHYFREITEDGIGNDSARGLGIRQVNDTNLGLWCTEEQGSIPAITFNIVMMTFPASSILHLVHYIQNFNLAGTNRDWAELTATLSQPITDRSKAAVFSGMIGSSSLPLVGAGGSRPGNAEMYIDGGNAVKLRYQTEANPDDDVRATFSVLEFK